MSDASVFSDFVCHLGEGPAADPLTGQAYWFDIMEKRLVEKSFTGSGTRVYDLPFHASVIAAVDGERQLIAGVGGLYLRDRASHRLTLLQPLDEGRTDMRTSDGRVHPSGALWISTMRWDKAAGGAAIYRYFRGELSLVTAGLAIPNGIAFSPDGRVAYFTDTPSGIVYRIDTDPADGRPLGEPRVFIKVNVARDGYPDGAVVDQDGVYWGARWGGARVVATAPDGHHLRDIALPAGQSSCPAFIGANADRMIVTSAYEGMDAAARAKDPLAGQTFLINQPMRGRFDAAVKIS